MVQPIRIVIILFSLLLSACGYHLRGSYLLPENITQISITGHDPYSQLIKDLKQELRMNKVDVVAPNSNIPNLHILNESDGKDTISIYQNSRAAEYSLSFRTSYQISLPGEKTQTFSTSVTRSFLDNPQASLAKSVEEDLLIDEMREQAAQQMLRQMAILKETNKLNATTQDSKETATSNGNTPSSQEPTSSTDENGVSQTIETHQIEVPNDDLNYNMNSTDNAEISNGTTEAKVNQETKVNGETSSNTSQNDAMPDISSFQDTKSLQGSQNGDMSGQIETTQDDIELVPSSTNN